MEGGGQQGAVLVLSYGAARCRARTCCELAIIQKMYFRGTPSDHHVADVACACPTCALHSAEGTCSGATQHARTGVCNPHLRPRVRSLQGVCFH